MLLKFKDVRVQFGTPPPTRVIITRIRDKFEVDGKVQDVLKDRCGRKRNSTDSESADAVMQDFVPSPSCDRGNVLVRLVSRIQCSSNFEHAINDIPLATLQTVCRSVRRRRWESSGSSRWTF